MKLFEAKPTFFALLLGHILVMEMLAWLIIYLFGPGWVPSTLAALILAISQVNPSTAVQPPKLSNRHRAQRIQILGTYIC